MSSRNHNYGDGPVARDRRTLITPEGINLQIELADIGARIGAMFIDLTIMIALLILAGLVLSASSLQINDEVIVSLFILIAFFLRSFYFLAFEMGAKGATPGKRLMKIRVAARQTAMGRAKLTANAVFARNALREIEFFLPLSFVFSNSAGIDGMIALLGFIWSGIFLFFPLFNKDRLRAGDLIAGTWVVKAPRPILAKDLVERTSIAEDIFAFTPQQIEAYGIHELHVLEKVLRANVAKTLEDVADRIRQKIDWIPSVDETDKAFLQAYYKALRKRLESRMLMGVKRKDKYDTR